MNRNFTSCKKCGNKKISLIVLHPDTICMYDNKTKKCGHGECADEYYVENNLSLKYIIICAKCNNLSKDEPYFV